LTVAEITADWASIELAASVVAVGGGGVVPKAVADVSKSAAMTHAST
jgi:hypothetical protein